MQHGIRVNPQWRICFVLRDGGAGNVEFVHGKRGISADAAIRLARQFGTSDEFWMNLQSRDVLRVERRALCEQLARDLAAGGRLSDFVDYRPVEH